MTKLNQKLEDFLQEYSRLETLLKKTENTAVTVLDYENGLTDIEAKEKLKVCRIIRNYCRHHEDYAGFIEVSDGMLKFLQTLNFELEKPFLHVSDKTKKITAVSNKDSLKSVSTLFMKHKVDFLPLVNPSEEKGKDSVDGIITRNMLVQMLAESGSLATKIGKALTPKVVEMSPEYFEASPEEMLDQYAGDEIIVVCKNGKYKGVVSW